MSQPQIYFRLLSPTHSHLSESPCVTSVMLSLPCILDICGVFDRREVVMLNNTAMAESAESSSVLREPAPGQPIPTHGTTKQTLSAEAVMAEKSFLDAADLVARDRLENLDRAHLERASFSHTDLLGKPNNADGGQLQDALTRRRRSSQDQHRRR